jgi:hypothetical protein
MVTSVRDWTFMSGSSWSARHEALLSEDRNLWLMNNLWDGCWDDQAASTKMPIWSGREVGGGRSKLSSNHESQRRALAETVMHWSMGIESSYPSKMTKFNYRFHSAIDMLQGFPSDLSIGVQRFYRQLMAVASSNEWNLIEMIECRGFHVALRLELVSYSFTWS